MTDSRRPPEPDPPPPAQLTLLATGYFTARAIYVAATLGIADLLDGRVRDAEAVGGGDELATVDQPDRRREGKEIERRGEERHYRGARLGGR